jgi:pyocin large subunit-like protein
MNRFMWDPTDEHLFERSEPGGEESSYSIRSLTDDDLLLAVDQAMLFEKNGRWPVEDTIVNRIWEKHKREFGDNPYHGRRLAYDSICREIAKRWHDSKSR